MATSVELATAYVSVVASTKGIRKDINKEVGAAEKDVAAAGRKSGGGFARGLMSGALAAGGIGLAFKSVVDEASNLEQSVGGLQAVFKGSFGEMQRESAAAAKSLGLSKNEYNELASTIGSGLKNKGIKDYAKETQNLIGLGSDLSAQFGGSTREAVDALASAMRGEMDPIEKYGVTLNQDAIAAEAFALGLAKPEKNLELIKIAQNKAIVSQHKYNEAVKKYGKNSDQAITAEAQLLGAQSRLGKAMDGNKPKLTDQQKAQAALSLISKQTADAQGAFARESDTLAGKQQRVKAQLDNVKASLGEGLLPILTDAGSVLSDDVVPAVQSFIDEWKAGTGVGGEVASAVGKVTTFVRENWRVLLLLAAAYGATRVAMAAYTTVTKAATIATSAYNLVKKAGGAIQAAWQARAYSMAAAQRVYTASVNGGTKAVKTRTFAEKVGLAFAKVRLAFTKAQTIAQRALNAVMNMSPIGKVILAITALVAGMVLLYKKNKSFRDLVNKVWAAIKSAMLSVVGWIKDTAWPWMRDALANMGAAASRLWTNHIRPAFTKIKSIAVSVFGWIRNTGLPWVRTAFGAIGKVVAWLWTNVYKRYFTFILSKVKSVFGWIKNKGWPAMEFAFQAIGDKASWLWKTAKSAFDSMRTGIGKVTNAFKTAKDGIGRIWSGLTSTISGPINAALGWLDRNFLSKVRSVLNAVGAGDLAKKIPSLRGPISDGAGGNRGGRQMGGSPQFARGGWTGPGSTFQPAGVVHADEFVVKKTSRRRFEQDNPGVLDHINRTGRMPGYAIGGKVAGLNKKFYEQLSAFNEAAGGKYSVYSGYRSIAEQQVLYNRYLSGNGPVAARPGGSQHNFGLAADLSPSNARVDADLARRFGLVFTVPSESWHIEPTWGRKGGAGGGVVGGGGGGFLSGLAAKVFDKGKSVLNGIIDKLPKSLGFWGGVGAGAMKMAVPAIFEKFKGAADLMGATAGDGTGGTGSGGGGGGGVNRWRTMVRKALFMTGQSPLLVGTVLRRMMQESGGNPNAVNNWDINAKRGDPSKGLMQVIGSTFRAYAMKGYSSNIFDPMSNILASFRYAIATYGSLSNAYNRAGGYARGTKNARSGPAWVGENGPELMWLRGGERIMPNHQSMRLARPVAASAPGMTGPIVVNVNDREGLIASFVDGRIDLAEADHARLARRGM